MKKILLTTFLIITLSIFAFSFKEKVNAENYTTFESIKFENDVVLLDSWSYERRNAYYNVLNKQKRKMFGWNKVYAYEKEPFDYIAETLYHVKNLGTEEITHTFMYSETYEETIQRSVTGSLEVDVENTKENKSKTNPQKFKFGLESELKFEYKQTNKTKTTQSDNVKIVIAPESELFIKVIGKGYLYSGLARKYFFWIVAKDGGFEYVIITTEYYSIDIRPIVGE